MGAQRKRRSVGFDLFFRRFSNWLHAISNLISACRHLLFWLLLLGRSPSGIVWLCFCYLNAIGEAHCVYRGLAWLRYDGQFRQHKSSLLRRLALSFFSWGLVDTMPQDNQPRKKKGSCWPVNEGRCKFVIDVPI